MSGWEVTVLKDKLRKDASKDGTYRGTPADKYVVRQLSDIMADYFMDKQTFEPNTKEEFENMLFKDRGFHKWLLETHKLYFLYKPLDNSWELSNA
jgi:hypothetical protein